MKRTCIVIAALIAPAAGAAYKCVDEKGITRIGDTPPAECANVVMYETTRSGAIMRKIDPTPTPEQLKARAEEAERMKSVKRAEGEQKRKDMALLNTFSTEKEFDVARERNIEPIKGRIASALERIKGVEEREKQLEEEMEFYRAGKSKARSSKGGNEAPSTLVADLQRVRAEKAALVSATAGYEKEIEQVRVKFDTDKKRWLELKAESALKPAQSEAKADAKPVDAKAPAKKH